jgi:uncharacterized cysteine cluster protein YcgN (CxxCxxCC family)
MTQCKKCGKCCYLRIGGKDMIIETHMKCKHLTRENLCAIYDDRPSWCLTAAQMASMNILPPQCSYQGGV